MVHIMLTYSRKHKISYMEVAWVSLSHERDCVAAMLVLLKTGTGKLQKLGLLVVSHLIVFVFVGFCVIERGLTHRCVYEFYILMNQIWKGCIS